MCEALKLLMKDEIDEERTDAAMERTKEIALAFNERGVALEVIADAIGVTVDVVRKWLGTQTA